MAERKLSSATHTRASAGPIQDPVNSDPSSPYSYRCVSALDAAMMWGAPTYPIWSGNRPLDEAHAHQIAQAITARGDFGPLPITIGKVASQHYIIDGQHRLRAASLLAPGLLSKLSVWICTVECGGARSVAAEEKMRSLFLSVNCGIPVPLRYLVPAVKKFIDDLVVAINEQWGIIYYGAPSIARPRIAHTVFVSAIDNKPSVRAAAQAQLLSVPVAMALLKKMNKLEYQRIPKAAFTDDTLSGRLWGLKSATAFTAIDNKKFKGFVLGLTTGWLDMFLGRLDAIWDGEEVNENIEIATP